MCGKSVSQGRGDRVENWTTFPADKNKSSELYAKAKAMAKTTEFVFDKIRERYGTNHGILKHL